LPAWRAGDETRAVAARRFQAQAFAHLEQRIAFEELLAAMDEAKARIARLERAIEEAVPDWWLAPMVTGAECVANVRDARIAILAV
jgi:hypothetical protein